jgi:NurA domain-containing protein
MVGDQASLFDRKKYKGVMSQSYQIEPPAADHTVIKTLLAYHTYLWSGGYSKYTPDDFTNDVKKFGLFVKDKKLSEVRTVDIQQWIGVAAHQPSALSSPTAADSGSRFATMV